MVEARLLAVLAHPDDETFRAGGSLALLARSGVRVWVLCATRGEAGVPGMDPEQAGQLRQAELAGACSALGIEPPRFLEYRDGTLSQINQARAIEQVVRAGRELRPQVLLTWPPDGVSGHPDHVAVSRWTGEAFQRAAEPAEYPQHQNKGLSPYAVAALYHIVVPHSLAERLGMTHLHTVPDHTVAVTVDVAAVWECKLKAIRCHRSQMGRTPILDASPDKQRLFLGTEHFQRAATRPGLLSGSDTDFFKRLAENNL